MKKYRNISQKRLSLDCVTHTIYLEPGVIMFLPLSRDIRYNLKLGNLLLIKEQIKKEITPKKIEIVPKPKTKRQWKQIKEEKTDSDLNKMETE